MVQEKYQKDYARFSADLTSDNEKSVVGQDGRGVINQQVWTSNTPITAARTTTTTARSTTTLDEIYDYGSYDYGDGNYGVDYVNGGVKKVKRSVKSRGKYIYIYDVFTYHHGVCVSV